ncbi:IS607 family transposase [Gloeothece verrucosa]|uniref:Resolvase domain protein n=1 Tax=Gloeothece verrucosa (strain PCC 7822) TaxID=497965 RepID=E0U7L8_GLOV7|nr:IS607 family transposase [Gloeothece verrucosa]ADN13714.1 Resolvase domain protein [Gloeothece verrucosa PCC 7822]
MKLSDYAKQAGVSYQTAWRWWQKGHLTGYQLPSGTIIITEKEEKKSNPIACIYARVSSAENKDNLDRQAERLKDYAIARGYQIYKVVKEVGSGLNDNRPKLAKILTDTHYTILIVEHKDRLARFGTNYLEILLKETGKNLEIVNLSKDKQDELMEDLIAIITSFCSRLYGLKRSKRKTEKIIAELKDES